MYVATALPSCAYLSFCRFLYDPPKRATSLPVLLVFIVAGFGPRFKRFKTLGCASGFWKLLESLVSGNGMTKQKAK